MKACSAAIVVLAGALLFTGGGMISHSGTGLTLMITGAVVGLIGLFTWWALVLRSDAT